MKTTFSLAVCVVLLGCESVGDFSNLSSLSSSSTSSTSGSTSVSTGSGTVTLEWTAPSGAVEGYYILQSADGVSYSQVLNVTSNTTRATVTGLTDGATYYFGVKAYNSAGAGAMSTATSTTVP